MMRFAVYKDNAGEWRWRLLGANNHRVAESSEGYKNQSDCIDIIKVIKGAVASVPVWDASQYPAVAIST
jgi:uncharacterized protein YegP (UPF0339 family)